MLNRKWLGLQFFAEGGTAGGSASGDGDGGNGSGLTGDFSSDLQRYFGISSSGDAGRGNADNGETEQGAADEGSVTEATGTDQAASSGQQEDDDGYQEFREKFKDRIHAEFQKSFNERFKKSKETETQLQQQNKALNELLAPLRDKYGLGDDATPEEMAEKIRDDKTNFSRQAMANGLSTESYRDSFYTRQAEKAKQAEEAMKAQEQRQQQEQQQRQAAMQETYKRWQNESAELKKSFPQFDLAKEIRTNKVFRQALEAGLPVDRAYYAGNFENITAGIAAAATQQSAVKAARTIASNRARPSEGGQNAGTGIKTGTDVAHMSGRDIRDILARVERGERIVL